MNLKYLLGSLVSIPLLPIMYYQGKRIRASVPSLPEATEPQGLVNMGAKEKLSLITIGESTIAGVGVDRHEEGFTGTLATALATGLQKNIQWRVYARSGYTAKRVTYKLLPMIEEEQVDMIVIGLGGNDAFHLNSPGKWKAQMRTLIDRLQSKFPESPIVFTNMPPIKDFPAFTPLIKFTIGNLVEILGQELKMLVAEYPNVYYYSLKITLEGWNQRLQLKAEHGDFFSDGVHPSKLTYQVWARDFANYIFNQAPLKKQLAYS